MGRPPLALEGLRFGNLVVVKRAQPDGTAAALWECDCDCGNTCTIVASSLASGATRSCGCLRKAVHTKHGMSRTRTYSIWRGMHDRCSGPNISEYHGKRGIKVCNRWNSFENFLSDMGEAPLGKSLDRYPNNDGDYEPGNCRWATPMEQQNNTRYNVNITFAGKTQSLSAWSRELGISHPTLTYRLKRWPLDQVFRELRK
jgi:hypothetical protein